MADAHDLTGVPKPPEKPDPQTCCQRGCYPCILDYYDTAMERWERRVLALGRDPPATLAAFEALKGQG